MSRMEKQQHRLEALENELRARLLPILRQVAGGRNTGFFVASPDRVTVQSLAEDIIGLAELLNTRVGDLVASKILAAFTEANDVRNRVYAALHDGDRAEWC